jgi:pimeloyl-ACP methyl ester carboxylesterase
MSAMTLSPEAWRDLGHAFDWRGHRIFGRVEGTGAPLLLIHGFPTASWDWAKLWPALVARHRVLALDLLGYGWSAKPRAFAYSVRAQADLVDAFLAAHGVTSYRLLAHDYGDTVAQELLARQREGARAATITHACLLNGGLFPETHRARLAQRVLASPFGDLLAPRMGYRRFAASMVKIWGAQPPSDDELGAMWRLVIASEGRLVIPQLLGYMDERRRFRERWVGAIVHAALPIRLVAGLADPVSGAHMVARYRELIPRPDVVELPGVGHYPQVEAPEAVLAAALPFLAS